MSITADRPIIFSALMVQALLAGRKTQTRRLIKPQPERFFTEGAPCEVTLQHVEGDEWPRIACGRVITSQVIRFRQGMRLWVRENCWAQHNGADGDGVRYAADGLWLPIAKTPAAVGAFDRLNSYAHSRAPDNATDSGQMVPSIHMPRWASRLTLTVTDVRAQRLQEISEEDAIAEGVQPFNWVGRTLEAPHFYNFKLLWNELHGAGAWEANPEVVALTFTVEQRNIDA